MNKYALGSIVLGIVLLALLGASRAARWLTQSTNPNTEDRIVVVDSNDAEVQDRGTLNTSQANALFGDDPESLSLAEAGTYIQRQKRVEEDSTIARTDVTVIPMANNSIQAAPTVVSQTPNNVESSPATTVAPSNAAIPALW